MVHFNNPFSDYGRVVSRTRFIGRQTEIANLQRRVLSEHGGGCVAIVGEARIGKTSLMHNVFHKENPFIQQSNCLIIDYNIGSINPTTTLLNFFSPIIRKIQREVRTYSTRDFDDLNVSADQLNDRIQSGDPNWYIFLLEYLEEVGDKGYQILLLLDEFDSIVNIFGTNEWAFQLIRQIGYETKYATTLVTTSRISIGQIEVQSLISTLSGIFSDVYINLFNEDEYQLLFNQRLKESEIQFSSRERNRLERFAGFHPYFSQIAAFHLWNFKAERKGKSLVNHEIDMALDKSRAEIYEQFDNFKYRMGDERFETLLSMTIGPKTKHIIPKNLSKLLQQGHLISTFVPNHVIYKPFSEVYEEYLQHHNRSINLWPLWNETKHKLGKLIEERFKTLAEEEDFSLEYYFEKKNPNLAQSISLFKTIQQREHRYFSDKTLIFDYATFEDLRDFLFEDWSIFSDLFQNESNANQILQDINFLVAFQQPQLHVDHIVTDSAIKDVEEICIKLIQLMDTL